MNTLYTNDNLYILNGLDSKSVDLIYIDPPFNSKRTYSAPVGSKSAGASFKDMWTWADVNEYQLEGMINNYPGLVRYIEAIEEAHSSGMKAYLTYMSQRLIEMHRVLKDTGSFYLHCDPTASHYLKIVMDFIFDKDNFRNEIVWCYTGIGGGKKYFNKKTDHIFFYSKGKTWTFNVDECYVPHKDPNQTLRKRMNTDGKYKNKETLAEYRKRGKLLENWWIIPLASRSKEYTGYPTQKPLKLLHRIIKASSKVGDVVLDAFCGCATTCVASQQLDRKWIGIDIEARASEILTDRLKRDAGMFEKFICRTDIPVRSDVKIIKPKEAKRGLFGEQAGKCQGCKRDYLYKDLTVDHIIPTSIGGGDYYENYQLLCGNCNSIKGKRPMEYLQQRVSSMQVKNIYKI